MKKSRADYFKQRRIGKKNFSVYIDETEVEKLERKLSSIEISKTDWIKKKIKEELTMDFEIEKKCPHCEEFVKADLKDYIIDENGEGRDMGTETEYTIECDHFICPNCGQKFRIRGSIWEYPVGAYNCDTIKFE